MICISEDAITRIGLLSQKLQELFGHENPAKYALMGKIMEVAMHQNVFGEDYDLRVFSDSLSHTDLGYVIESDKGSSIAGGINCNSHWFNDFIKGCSLDESLKKNGIVAIRMTDVPAVTWSSNT